MRRALHHSLADSTMLTATPRSCVLCVTPPSLPSSRSTSSRTTSMATTARSVQCARSSSRSASTRTISSNTSSPISMVETERIGRLSCISNEIALWLCLIISREMFYIFKRSRAQFTKNKKTFPPQNLEVPTSKPRGYFLLTIYPRY